MDIGNRDGQIEDDGVHQSKETVVDAVFVTRPTTRLEEGSAYVARLRWMDCYTLQRKVEQHIERITGMTRSTDDVHVVESELSAFRATSEELRKAVAVLMNDLVNPEDLDVANDWYAVQSSRMVDFMDRIEHWISSTKEKILNSLESRSDCSKHSGSSRRTKASSRSSTQSSIASGRAKERAKGAELMAKFAIVRT